MSDTPELPDDDGEEGNELMRVWLIGEGTLQCSINMAETPELWSQILADLTQHIAGAIADERGVDPDVMLRELHEGVTKFLNETPEDDA